MIESFDHHGNKNPWYITAAHTIWVLPLVGVLVVAAYLVKWSRDV